MRKISTRLFAAGIKASARSRGIGVIVGDVACVTIPRNIRMILHIYIIVNILAGGILIDFTNPRLSFECDPDPVPFANIVTRNIGVGISPSKKDTISTKPYAGPGANIINATVVFDNKIPVIYALAPYTSKGIMVDIVVMDMGAPWGAS
jgi:hypothetical protein